MYLFSKLVRDEEVHHLRLYKVTDVAEKLRQTGFQIQVMRDYGQYELPKAHAAFIAVNQYELMSKRSHLGWAYTIWYHALPGLKATQAATVQLIVPILAAIAAIPLLHEPMTLRLGLAAIAVLGGIALVIMQQDTTGPSGRVSAQPGEPLRSQQRDGMFLTLSHHSRWKLIWSLWLVTWLALLAGLVSWQWYGGNYSDRS